MGKNSRGRVAYQPHHGSGRKKGVVFLGYITKNEYICTRLTIHRQQVLYTYRMNVILCMSYETAFRGQTHGETFAQY